MCELEESVLSLAEETGALLREKNWFLATAESCTGGLIGHLITSISGSSDYFEGGVISYSNRIKAELLGIQEEVLAEHGAVSEPVAAAMARGARELLGADIAVSVTGIAGPTGGTPEKPVGTTYIGAATLGTCLIEHHEWLSDRSTNKLLSAQAALKLAHRLLRETAKA